MPEYQARVGAYAVCVRAGAILLVHQAAPGPAKDRWTLPGGGVNFGEHPADTVLRELGEETGLTGEIGALLGVHDNVYDLGDGVLRHGVRLLFAVEAAGARPDRRDRCCGLASPRSAPRCRHRLGTSRRRAPCFGLT